MAGSGEGDGVAFAAGWAGEAAGPITGSGATTAGGLANTASRRASEMLGT